VDGPDADAVEHIFENYITEYSKGIYARHVEESDS